MKRKTGKGSAWVTGLLVLAALALALWPAEGRTACTSTAAVICASVTADDTTDCDEDGFSDYLECKDFTTTGGTTFKTYLGFPNRGDQARDKYLDPAGKDLFVVVAETVSDNIKQADLDSVAATLQSQLGVAVHYILSTDIAPNRQVTGDSPQKGLAIVENSDTTTGADATTLGYTYPLRSNPNDVLLSATVYTGRLKSFVNTTTCPLTGKTAAPKCVTSAGVGRQSATDATGLAQLIGIYNQQNIIHELSHALSLADVTGAHRAVVTVSPFNNSIMSTYVFTKAYNKTSTEPAKQVFYIPFIYDPSDKTAFKLK